MSEEYGKTKITNTPKTANGNGGGYTQTSSSVELETFEENEIIPTSSYTNSQGNRVNNYDLEDASLLLQDSQFPITGLENSLYNFSQEFDENGRFLNSKLYLYDGYDVLSLSEKQAKINSTLFLSTYFIQNVEFGNDSYTIYVDPSKPATQENLTFEVPAGPDRQAKTVNIDVNDIYSINAGQEEVIITYRNGCQETYDYRGNCTMLNTSVPEGFEVEGASSSFYDSNRNRYDIYQKDGIEYLAQGQDFTISASDDCRKINRGYRYADVNGNVIKSEIEFTNGIPNLSVQENSLQIGDNMQISSTNNLDISLEENGYHVFMKEKEDGSITTPNGVVLDCKNVDDIVVTREEMVVHLSGEGYLKYEKSGKVTYKVSVDPDKQVKDLPFNYLEVDTVTSRQDGMEVTYRNGCQATYDSEGNCTMINASVSDGFSVEGAYTSFYDSKLNRYDLFHKEDIEQLYQNPNFTISGKETCPNISRGYQYVDTKGSVVESGIEFTNGVPKLSFQDKTLKIGDNMQISSTNNLDISLEENGYHVSMNENKDGTITTPDGWKLDSKHIEDISVTDEGTVIRLSNEGYLKYDQNGTLIERKMIHL